MPSEETKYLLGVIAVIISFISYIPYSLDIYRGQTKPHVFSWLIWGILMIIGFVAQVVSNAGAGSMMMGVGALQCLLIFILTLRNGDRDINKFDKGCLAVALAAVLIWVVTSNPLYSVILVTGIDSIGYLPTFRKVFHRPYGETAITWFLLGLSWIFSIIALRDYTFVNVLYPATVMVMNWSVLAILLARRRSSRAAAQSPGPETRR